MTDKITLQNVASIDNSLINAINNNNATLTAAIDNTLSRDGTVPNQMLHLLDMNSNPIINIPYASSNNQPVAFGQLINNAQLFTATFNDITGTVSSAQMHLTRANVLDFGAVGDGVTDCTTAFNNAIASLPEGGLVYFPAQSQPYIISSTILLPDNCAIWLLGDGITGTTIQTNTVLANGMIQIGSNSSVFNRGHKISNMTLSGNGLAAYNINGLSTQASHFSDLELDDATVINFRIGDGTSNSQENIIRDIRVENQFTSVLANLPTYCLEINGSNNDVCSIKLINAKTAQLHSSSTASGNKYVTVHGYTFNDSLNTPLPSPFQFLIDGSEEQIIGCECDGASTANIQINGFINNITNGYLQFQGITPSTGIQFATGTSGNIVTGIIVDVTAANCIVQAGTPAAQGNIAISCYSSADGVFIEHKLEINNDYSKQVPTTGFSITCSNANADLILDPAGTLATGSVFLPNFPSDGQVQRIVTTQTITSLTVGGGGHSIKNAPTTLAAGGFCAFRFVAANTTWYRIG